MLTEHIAGKEDNIVEKYVENRFEADTLTGLCDPSRPLFSTLCVAQQQNSPPTPSTNIHT